MGLIVEAMVWQKLDKLVRALHNKKYFGYEELAHQYADELSDFIFSIPGQRAYATKNRRHGAWYCRYKPNRNTTWYITFDTDGNYWVVRNVFSSHSKGYPAFIREL